MICGCTEEHACDLPDGTPCSWADPQETVCTGCAAGMEYVGELGGSAVFSPGTYGPDGLGPLLPELRAAFGASEPEAPTLILSFGPGSKE
jgi:hypothetical protein